MNYNPFTDQLLDEPVADSIPLTEESRTGPNSSFVEGSQAQFAWDSVSLNSFKTCPRKYLYEIINGYELKVRPATLSFGISFHTCLETWHKLLASGMSKDTALLRVTRLAGLLGESIPPGDTARTKETLMRTVVWYIFQFWDDQARTTQLTTGKPAVEFSFTFPLGQVNGVEIYLSGHIDRVVEYDSQVFISDYKTTKSALDHRYFDQYKPNGQLKQYMLAGVVLATDGTAIPEPPAGVLVEAAQLGVTFSRFQRFPVMYSAADLEEYAKNTLDWVTQAHYFASVSNWPMNESSCDKYGGCTFREICRQSPGYRDLYLNASFHRRTWDPLRAR